MDNFRFQLPTLVTEGTRPNRSHHVITPNGTKRIFRIGANRTSSRQAAGR